MSIVKKNHHHCKSTSPHERLCKSEPSQESVMTEIVQEEVLVEESFKEQTPVKRSLKIDPRQISNLSEQERVKIKEQHPQMNEYFCMSARDKSKFFHLLNQKYRQDVKLLEPPGSAPMKKTIHFKKRFEIKPFGYQQKIQSIKLRKSFMELYRAKDESKHKKISKFPKVM